ncbi:MAG: hypothetical protein P8Y52_12140 [Xanthomonadales bacterium]
MTENSKQTDQPAPRESENRESKDRATDRDALETFFEKQGEKCAAHHRAHTSEVLELIRKHRKD